MSEGHQNIEVAHVLHERNAHHHRSGGGKGVEILEILDEVTLAIMAVAPRGAATRRQITTYPRA